MTQPEPSAIEVQQTIQPQVGKLLSQMAGYVGVRTMDIGWRFGLLEETAKHSHGIMAEALAKQKGLDSFYVQVWCVAPPMPQRSWSWERIKPTDWHLMWAGCFWSRISLGTLVPCLESCCGPRFLTSLPRIFPQDSVPGGTNSAQPSSRW